MSKMSSPREKFDLALKRNVRNLISFIGIDILDEDYQPDLVLVLICSMIVVFVVVCVNSIIHSDLETGIQCITFLAIAIQCPGKIYTGVQYRHTYRRHMDTCRNIYREIERSKSQILHQNCTQFSYMFCLLLNIHCVIVLSSGALILCCPLLAFVIFGVRYFPVLPTGLPWMDTSQGLGYVLNTTFGMYLTVIAVLGILSSDAGFLILIMHTYLYKILIAFKVQQLNGKLRENERAKAKPVISQQMAKICKAFRFIMDHHKAYYLYGDPTIYICCICVRFIELFYCSFTKEVSDLYYYISTAEIYSDGMCLCTLVYVVLEIKSVTAYGLFVVFLYKLLLFSSLGMVMQLSNDEFYSALMTIDWYKLPQYQNMQHMVLLTQMSARAVSLKAGVADLNMAVFVNVMKTVYTVAMILVQMED